MGSWSKGLKHLAILAVLFTCGIGAAAAQSGGVFMGGQKFVTLTAATTNCQTIAIPGPHQIVEISLQSTSATNNFLHLYDLATTPVAGALPGQIGVYVLPGVGANVAGGFAANLGSLSASVVNGIAFCITGGLPLADASAGSVGGVVNWTVK